MKAMVNLPSLFNKLSLPSSGGHEEEEEQRARDAEIQGISGGSSASFRRRHRRGSSGIR